MAYPILWHFPVSHFNEKVRWALDYKQIRHVRRVIVGELFARDPDAALLMLTNGMGKGPRRAVKMLASGFRAFYEFRHDITSATIEAGRATVLAALDRIERQLQPSGYLVGERFSVADLTAAALLSPLVMPPEFPYPPEVVPELVARYRESLAGRAAFQWALDIYRRHRGVSAEVR